MAPTCFFLQAVPSANATQPSEDAPLPPPSRPGRTAAPVAPAKPQDNDAVDLDGFQAPDEATIRCAVSAASAAASERAWNSPYLVSWQV